MTTPADPVAPLVEAIADRVAKLVVERLGKKENPAEDELLTEREAAERLRVHPSTLREWRRAHRIRALQLGSGRCWRYEPEELDRFARECAQERVVSVRRRGARGNHV